MTADALPLQLDAAAAPHRPAGHQPHAPAWTAVLDDATPAIVAAQLAVQAPDPATAAAAAGGLDAALDAGPDAPAHVDRVVHVDAAGLANRIALAYWADPGAAARWAAQPAVRALWEDADPAALGEVGHWREVLEIPRERVETLHSSDRGGQGAARLAPIHPTDVHEYPGAMRDRMAISRVDPLDPAPGAPPAPAAVASRGRRLRAELPANACFIRTAQDWSACGPDERERYVEHVEPTLRRGAEYLRDTPEESGCLSSRFVRELDARGEPLERSCVLAWFRSLADLERWTHSHPTHLAILGEFFALVEQGGGRIDLALWHEVCTLPAGAARLEYVNCHPATGLLAHCPVTPF